MKRRNFLLGSAAVVAGAAAVTWLPGVAGRPTIDDVPIPPAQPRRAAVVWFSQTGHTRRIGQWIARLWQAQGLDVVASDYRQFDRAQMPAFDLIVLGSPVNYFEAPGHFQTWIDSLPPLAGTRVAAYVTFGGEGGNTFNAASGMPSAATAAR